MFGILFLLAITYFGAGCNKFPTDEDGLLITDRAECYIGNFNVLGVDQQTVLVGSSAPNLIIDTTQCTIDALVFFGTDLKNLYPQFSLVTDAKLEPKVTGLTDFSSPRQYTVVSGNRKVRKTYTVTLTVLKP